MISLTLVSYLDNCPQLMSVLYYSCFCVKIPPQIFYLNYFYLQDRPTSVSCYTYAFRHQFLKILYKLYIYTFMSHFYNESDKCYIMSKTKIFYFVDCTDASQNIFLLMTPFLVMMSKSCQCNRVLALIRCKSFYQSKVVLVLIPYQAPFQH